MPDKEEPTRPTETPTVPAELEVEAPADGSDDPGAEGSGDLTAEERLAQTEAELAEERRKNEQLLSERGRVARERAELEEERSTRTKLEERDRQLAEQQRGIAQRIAQLQHIVNSDDYSEDQRFQAQLHLDQWQARYADKQEQRQEISELKSEVVAMGQPEEMRDEIKQYIKAGYDPQIARYIVRGKLAESASPGEPPTPTGPKPGAPRRTLRSVPADEHGDRVRTIEEHGEDLSKMSRVEASRRYRELKEGKVKTA